MSSLGILSNKEKPKQCCMNVFYMMQSKQNSWDMKHKQLIDARKELDKKKKECDELKEERDSANRLLETSRNNNSILSKNVMEINGELLMIKTRIERAKKKVNLFGYLIFCNQIRDSLYHITINM